MKSVSSLIIALLVALAATADGLAEVTGRPTVAVTQWTDAMELFMEYPAPVSGQPTAFIVHLTIIDGFQPVREGTLTLNFRGPDGSQQQVVSGELLREGIFKPEVTLTEAGAYTFEMSYRGPGVTGS